MDPRPPELTQAERVLKKFGGARRLSAILLVVGKPRDPSCIYRWTYPKEKGGTGGLIPTSVWPDLILAAKYDGVLLESELTDPRTFAPKKRHRYDETWNLKTKRVEGEE